MRKPKWNTSSIKAPCTHHICIRTETVESSPLGRNPRGTYRWTRSRRRGSPCWPRMGSSYMAQSLKSSRTIINLGRNVGRFRSWKVSCAYLTGAVSFHTWNALDLCELWELLASNTGLCSQCEWVQTRFSLFTALTTILWAVILPFSNDIILFPPHFSLGLNLRYRGLPFEVTHIT